MLSGAAVQLSSSYMLSGTSSTSAGAKEVLIHRGSTNVACLLIVILLLLSDCKWFSWQVVVQLSS